MNTRGDARQPVFAGIGESRFGRRVDKSLQALVVDAISSALADAGLEPGDIDAVFTESAVMPMAMPIDLVEAAFGLRGLRRRGYFSSVGVGVALAVATAAEAVRAGAVEHALVYFGLDWGSRAGGPYDFHSRYESKPAVEHPYGFYAQPTYFALMARRYAHIHGLGEDELAEILGGIAIRQRTNAATNPNAQMTTPLTMDEYRTGRMISDPLRLHDCCLVSDGAVAIVISSLLHARDTERSTHAALIGAGYASTGRTEESCLTQGIDYPSLPAARRSAAEALGQAGIGPSEIAFAEIYDCFTISVLLQLDELGVCEAGESRWLLEAGELPVNTHGGLLSQAYILGTNHITEAVRQVRGEAGAGQVPDASIGAVQLAPSADHATLVLARL